MVVSWESRTPDRTTDMTADIPTDTTADIGRLSVLRVPWTATATIKCIAADVLLLAARPPSG
jgi:hypothetical protein